MEQDLEKELQEIMGGFTCPKDFKCYKSGFENLCQANDVGKQTFVQCLELNPDGCSFSKLIAIAYICYCPLRIYISKKLKK